MQLKVSSLHDEKMGQNSECFKSKKMWVLAAHYFSPFFFSTEHTRNRYEMVRVTVTRSITGGCTLIIVRS